MGIWVQLQQGEGRDRREGRKAGKVQVQSAADVRCDVGRTDRGGELMLRCLGKVEELLRKQGGL